ncbi:MAG: hypothetical protein FWE87_01995 [Coriobacteriia bacterium]|nr:hypothetical protein [Coriobacteriia bacterium]
MSKQQESDTIDMCVFAGAVRQSAYGVDMMDKGKGLLALKPFIAVILGILAGLVSFACNVVIPKLPAAKNPEKQLVYSFGGLLASTIISIVALLLYWLFFESTFVQFGVALCVTFIIGLMVYFLQNINVLKKTRRRSKGGLNGSI